MNTPVVTCVGEALIDLVSTDTSPTLSEAPGFVKALGGESANVVVGLARLGTPSAFVGKVGNDSFGRFIVTNLAAEGVDTRGVRLDKEHKTRLAFVSLTKSGERDFEFWERRPAGEQLAFGDLNVPRIARSRIVNIAPFLLYRNPSRSAALRLAAVLRRSGCRIAFDANLRLALWRSRSEAKNVLLRMVRLAHILRLNEDEAAFLTGKSDPAAAARSLRRMGPDLVAITRGRKGCYYQTAKWSGEVAGFRVRAVDTTGCGDGFLAGLLHRLAARSGRDLEKDELDEICRFANAVGALVALRRGGAAAMPGANEVKRFLKQNGWENVFRI